jgi:outer membrane protein assembly factor BamB
MALAGGALLAASITGDVAGFDTMRGSKIWHHKLPGRIYQGVWTSGSLAFILNDRGTLYAFTSQPPVREGDDTPQDHIPLWERKLPVPPGAVIAVSAEMLIIAGSDGRLLRIDPDNGESVFDIQLDAPIYSQPLVTRDLIVVANAAGEITALRGSDGSQQWQVTGEGLIKHRVLATGGVSPQALLVAFARGDLLALELATGQELWRYRLEKPLELACLTADGIAVTDRQNRLYYIRLDSPPH